MLAGLAVLALPATASAHAKKAVPIDPKLNAQYQQGLTAYLNSDYAAALAAWRPLAERRTESSAAQVFLGLMYAKGMGVAADPEAAAAWYLRAAKQDDMLAQLRLAFLYRGDDGAAADPIQAYLWAALAARRDSHLQKVAAALRDAIAAELGPTRLAEAKGAVDGWIAAHRRSE